MKVKIEFEVDPHEFGDVTIRASLMRIEVSRVLSSISLKGLHGQMKGDIHSQERGGHKIGSWEFSR